MATSNPSPRYRWVLPRSNASSQRAVRISPADRPALQLVQHLGISRQVLVGHEIRGCRAGDGLFHAVAVAVIDQLHASGVPGGDAVGIRASGQIATAYKSRFTQGESVSRRLCYYADQAGSTPMCSDEFSL